MQRTVCIDDILKSLNIKQKQLAEKLGVNPMTIWRWRKNGIPKHGAARALLERLADEAA